MLPYDCLHCTDVLCTNNKHIESVQLLHDNIISQLWKHRKTFQPQTAKVTKFLVGLRLCKLIKKLLCFGEVFGYVIIPLDKV